MMDSALIDTTQRPIRVHLKWDVALVPMLLPVVTALVVALKVATADELGGRMFAAVAALVLGAFVVNFWWSYRLEVDDELIRRVRPFWLGTQEIPLTELSGVYVRPSGPFHARRISFESQSAEIRLMYRNQRYGSAWRVRDLRRLVEAVKEHGAYVDPSINEYLSKNW